MQSKICELTDVVCGPIDLKKLQLRLQGSVAVTVNAGPLAYASAFLDPKLSNKYPEEKVEELKKMFIDFNNICYTALQINGGIISSDQKEYHLALNENYQSMCIALNNLVGENLGPNDYGNSMNCHRNSLALFSAISGTPNNSSTA